MNTTCDSSNYSPLDASAHLGWSRAHECSCCPAGWPPSPGRSRRHQPRLRCHQPGNHDIELSRYFCKERLAEVHFCTGSCIIINISGTFLILGYDSLLSIRKPATPPASIQFVRFRNIDNGERPQMLNLNYKISALTERVISRYGQD